VSPGAPRVLAILGSGETAPTMVTTHREIVARFGAEPRAVLLDTPYGFQENAAELTGRALEYFARRVQLAVEPVGFLGPLAVDPALRGAAPTPAALARLRAADYVFAGPGSPSYALMAWRPSPVPEALSAKLARGGAVVFASAAALTLGRFTLPVYEVYKVGQPPHWLDGLDLVGAAGLGSDVAVIPHFDNAEGGTHDTRYCYMGERRLQALEALLPADGWVLGIDEHTGLVLDLGAGEATVTGRGAVTVRRRDGARCFPAGSRFALEALLAAAREAAPAGMVAPGSPGAPAPGAGPTGSPPGATAPGATGAAGPGDAPARPGDAPRRSPLLAEVTRLEQAFQTAVQARQAGEAAEAILRLDRTILEWAADSLQSDDPDRARAVLHTLVHRLGEAAADGLRDPRETLAPLVAAMVAFRAELRARRAWELADRLRDALAAAGVELRDSPEGTTWVLRR
jgi:hypothetical protein